MSRDFSNLWAALERLITDDSRGAKVLDGLWKFAEEDFHGVRDAAVDIERIDARAEAIASVRNNTKLDIEERCAATDQMRRCIFGRGHTGAHKSSDLQTWL